MTAYSQMQNVGYVSFNRVDSPLRSPPPDDTQPWLDIGFVMTDWNKFQFTVKSRTYHITPGRAPDGEWGIKITGCTINGDGLFFPANHPPAKIALYLTNLADNPVEV